MTRVAAVMPTIPTREPTAAAVVETLTSQGASVLVHLNGHDVVPSWARAPSVSSVRHPRGTGPSIRLETIPEADVILFVDDDMRYPADYVAASVAALRRLGAGTAIAYHGSFWPRGSHGRFTERRLITYAAASPRDRPVAMMGTGTTAFHRADLMRVDRNVPPAFVRDDDVWLSAACARARIRMIRPKTGAGWINHTPAAHDGLFRKAIVDGFVKRDAVIAAARKLGTWRLEV